ncbi:TIGR04104 family putative zinc finger protein [Clostridium folliculivorans]|uniref:TIGR04104 family putative zinc finger protein n=1 Tax=Clostridium folliculivorans TaxID=2886038 RepID=UPI003D08DA9C
MLIKKCEKCGDKISWLKVFISIMSGFTNIKCDKCQTEYYIISSYRLIIVVSVSFPLFLRNQILKILSPQFYSILAILWLIFMLSLSPFLLRTYVKKH